MKSLFPHHNQAQQNPLPTHREQYTLSSKNMFSECCVQKNNPWKWRVSVTSHHHHHHPFSFLTSFLPSCPPTAQVPVLVAVPGRHSTAVQSGFPTFLHVCCCWMEKLSEISPYLPFLTIGSLLFPFLLPLEALPALFYTCWCFVFICPVYSSLLLFCIVCVPPFIP